MAVMDVTVLTPRRVLFNGKARNIILPGELGVFEVLPFHKSLLSRLISGILYIDEKGIAITRGVVKVYNNIVTIIIESD